jgi:hypothetical protein
MQALANYRVASGFGMAQGRSWSFKLDYVWSSILPVSDEKVLQHFFIFSKFCVEGARDKIRYPKNLSDDA